MLYFGSFSVRSGRRMKRKETDGEDVGLSSDLTMKTLKLN